jgi:hypothetical protein
MAEITQVVSETLQNRIRELLPSQAGFGEDLQASNVIIPIVDLTDAASTAAGSPSILTTALSFTSVTAFSQVGAGTTIIANSPGYWRIFASATVFQSNTLQTANIQVSDGLSVKILWQLGNMSSTGSSGGTVSDNIDVIVFLAAGDSVSAVCNRANNTAIVGSTRQIATIDGTLVQPS